jgi:hypothetical protein
MVDTIDRGIVYIKYQITNHPIYMNNEIENKPFWIPENFCVTRIGMGTKLHLSANTTSRLMPACGLDSPYSRAINTHRSLKDITCKHCIECAIKNKLI